jgi:hypothetical protein
MKVYRPVFTRDVIFLDVAGNIVISLIIVSPLAIWAWIAFGSDSTFIWRFVSFIPVFILALYCINIMARLQWKMWVRRERWTTYFQTRNTLAIKIPFRPISFVKRQECLGFIPGGGFLILRDGTKYKLPGVPAGDESALSRGEEIIKTWWPELDIERIRARRKRKLPARGVTIVTVVAVVLLRSMLHAVLEYNGIIEAGEIGSLVVDAWLVPLVYVLARWLLWRYYDFKFPLPYHQVAQQVEIKRVVPDS